MKSIVALALSASFALVLLSGASAGAEKKPTDKIKVKSDVVVVVKAGDTLTAIAKEHDTTYVELYNANKDIANPDVIDVGDKVRIPKKDEKLPDRFLAYQSSVASTPAYRSPASYTTKSYTAKPVNSSSYYVGNGMWCTDYVHSKRPDVAIYGNAGYGWISAARADGKATGTTPKAGAVAVMNGHVAYVEGVNKDGSYTVSEMGWNYQAGNYHKRTVQPGTFGGFIY